MKDYQVVSSLAQLKALVAGLYGKLDRLAAGDEVAPVDFAVDMFDRVDQNTLGEYWDASVFRIRGGRAINGGDVYSRLSVASVAGYAAYVSAAVGISSTLAAGGIPSSITLTSGLSGALYTRPLTATDMLIRVVADGDGAVYTTPGGTVIDADVYGVARATISVGGTAVAPSPSIATTLASVGGACVGDATGSYTGVAAAVYAVPSMSASSQMDYVPTVGAPGSVNASIAAGQTAGRVLFIGSSKLHATPVSDSDPTIYSDSNTATDGSGATASATITRNRSGLLGAHQLSYDVLMEAVGSYVTTTISGVTVDSGVKVDVPPASRTRAGIIAPRCDLVSSLVALGISSPGSIPGMAAFKAWRNDIPEPPNETGHGTYVNGRWQYTDKYHTPVVDEDGVVIRNEDGTIAGYVYDPNA